MLCISEYKMMRLLRRYHLLFGVDVVMKKGKKNNNVRVHEGERQLERSVL